MFRTKKHSLPSVHKVFVFVENSGVIRSSFKKIVLPGKMDLCSSLRNSHGATLRGRVCNPPGLLSNYHF